MRRLGPAAAALALLACAAPAAALPTRGADGVLSPALDALSTRSLWNAPPWEQARVVGLPTRGPGGLLRRGPRVLVEVRFEAGAPVGLKDLEEAGADPVAASRLDRTVSTWVEPAALPALGAVDGVAGVTEVLAPIVSAACPSGIAVSEGDGHLRAAEARNSFGVDGTGVTVGVLSDSFDQAPSAPTDEAADVASGDLPGAGNPCAGHGTPVGVLEDFADPESSDEGRAMAQIVHDLAPGARLSFATAFTGISGFAQNIEELAAAGADVIVDDVSYFEEPFFQEGPLGVAVSNVTDDGVTYFSSAGNNNLLVGGLDISSWEANEFRDSGSCPAGVPVYATHCMDFDPAAGSDTTFALRVEDGATLRVNLQWAQPWNGVTTDLDAYLLDGAGAVVSESEKANFTATQKPFEFLAWTNSTGSDQTVLVAINRCDKVSCDPLNGGDGTAPRLKFALMQNGGGVSESEYPESTGGDVVGSTIFGHNGAVDAISTGAIRFGTTTQPEPFSSRGPVAHYFGPTNGVLSAPPLASPSVLSKPDLVATDCGVTTFFVPTATPGLFRFCGTSAAAPHAAAVAALVRDANGALGPAQIRSALTSTAVPVGVFGASAVGAGRVDALAALAAVAVPMDGGGVSAPAAPSEPTPTSPAPARPPAAVDVSRPGTFIAKRPRKVVPTRGRTARVVFRFRSDEAAVTFLCRVDRRRFRRCPARFVRRFGIGRHVIRVKARDAAGNVDRTPAVWRFHVMRRG